MLDRNDLTNLNPLMRLNALETLSVRNNELQSLTSLSGHPSLLYLSAGMNRIPTLSDLELPGLIGVSVDDTGMTQFGSLGGIPNLLTLGLANNALTSLKGIADAPRLQRVSFTGNLIADLTELSSLHELEELALAQTPATDLAPLSSLRKMRRLDLEASAVVDLSPLQTWENLNGGCRWVGVTDQALTASSLDVATRLCRAGWDVEPICEGGPCLPHL